MGTALIVTTVPEEALATQFLYDTVDGKEVRLLDVYGQEQWFRMRGQLNELHPRAYYRLPVRREDVWELPAEPRSLTWHEKPELRQKHRIAVKESLETFINGRLARLNHMLRSGWWVLGRVRIRVTACSPVPERVMRGFAKALSRSSPRAR